MKIFYDYHKETEFGQITTYDKNDEKISVINIEKIDENEFKKLFALNQFSHRNKDYFEYGHRF